ncbi:MAG: methyltransferase domain-containing protein, partial [Bdellovibrionales bacterium]|nr:methyltransferase domain-containing protein [Bdellovibrionales bacterium]
MSTANFYDQIAPFYELIYPDWNASIVRQADHLSSIIRNNENFPSKTVLDVSCGIGTQALGLAKLGYEVTASDLSSEEIKRAQEEAVNRSLNIQFSTCDMREVFNRQGKTFDVVLSADNSIPHLLSDEEILTALQQFYCCTNPGGLCVLTVRDYENEELVGGKIKPYAVQERPDGRYLIFQVWDVRGEIYETSMYCIRDLTSGGCESVVSRAKYYAIPTHRLLSLMQEAGFCKVRRLDGVFFQPVLIG